MRPRRITSSYVQRVEAECRRVLDQNWRTGVRDGVPYAYTAPSPGRYPWQWYWDSLFAAISRRHFDPARARQEMESLLSAARPDGFIGHTIFWGSPVSWPRAAWYNVKRRTDPMTSTIQPPLLAWAWSIVVGDPALEPRIVRHHEQIAKTRDLAGDGLIWIIQPDESGLDASPMFDAVWGNENGGKLGFRNLVVRNRKLNFDAKRIAAAGGQVVCEPMTNTLWGLSQLALGKPSITPALVARCWDPQKAMFVLDSHPATKEAPADTWAGLAPLALPDLPDDIGHAVVKRHVLNNKRFWTPVAPPSVAIDDPAFSRDDHHLGLRQYWRGPTWVNSAWMIWMGLQRLGYTKEAQQLARAIGDTVLREGLREYYDPFDGKGMGAHDFAWSTLVLDMVKGDPRARTSYITPAAGVAIP